MNKPKYNIGDKVYHVTPESPVGIILDIIYTYSDDSNDYVVTFSHNEQLRCVEHEISLNKAWG